MPIKPIIATVNELFEGTPRTFLSAAMAAGDGTSTVENINDFAVNQILFFGERGGEDSEIIKTHSATAPSGSTVTLASNALFAHDVGTPVYVIDYDQVEFSHATTATGVKTVLATQNIDADAAETTYRDSVNTSGYYFIRFKNSITSVFSGYSDPIPYAGWSVEQVGYIIGWAMRRNHISDFTEFVTHDFCIDTINECLSVIRGKLKRWHELQDFDHVMGQTARGENEQDMPTEAWDWSNKSVLSLRIGDGPGLSYRDKTEWNDEVMNGVARAELSAASLTGATTITVSDSNDLDDSGSAMVRGIVVTYTANNKATGVLSGIPASGDGSITEDLSIGDSLWQGAYEEGQPSKYTVYGGKAYYWPLPSATYAGLNAVMDYWKEAPSVDSDADTIDFGRYDMVKFYLAWAIRAEVKNDGKRDPEDEDYKQFVEILGDAIRIHLQTHGQKNKTRPHLNKIIQR